MQSYEAVFMFANFGVIFLGDLSPFDFFRQETSNADVVVRTEAMDKVAVIAALMGPERVRADLIPYLLGENLGL